MNLIVYNRSILNSDPSIEAFALRFGLLMADFTFAIGELPYSILYREQTSKMSEPYRIKAMLKSASMEQERTIMSQAAADLKLLRAKKNKGHHELVFLKRTEKFIEQAFETYLDNHVAGLSKFGLCQLAPLKENKSGGLKLWQVDSKAGETVTKYELSNLLACHFTEETIDGSDVLVLSGNVTEGLDKQLAMTQLCEVPNLNTLLPNQLLAAREQLAPLRQELHQLIPLMQPAENGKRYCTGSWNIEGVKRFSERLQEGLSKVPELEWSANLQKEIRSVINVGSMDTPALWQLLRDHDLLQDDTWEALSKRVASGDYYPQTPILTVMLPTDFPRERYFNEAESLQHKRKTINLK